VYAKRSLIRRAGLELLAQIEADPLSLRPGWEEIQKEKKWRREEQ
jgi:hypothetical protein